MLSVTPKAAANQTLRYYSGAGLVTSWGRNCSVVFGPLDEVHTKVQDTMFLVAITNQTADPVLVRAKDIEATTPSSWGKSSKLVVVDKSARITELEQQRAADRFAAAMVGVSAAIQSAQPAIQSGYVTSGTQSAYFSGATTDPALAAQAQQQGIANSLAISNASEARFAQAMAGRSSFFATNTVMPGETYSAVVAVQPPNLGFSSAEATYHINVCNEAHTFNTTYDTASATGRR